MVIIGLGNEYLSDDGAGVYAVRLLKQRMGQPDGIAFEELAVGGLPLVDYIIGYERCVIIDAVVTGTQPPGTLYRFVQHQNTEPVKLTSSHQVDLSQILGLAQLFRPMTGRTITVYGVEVSDTTTFSNRCTEQVAKAIPQLVNLVCEDLMQTNDGRSRTARSIVPLSPRFAGDWEIVSA